jgi:hypothetical protein
MKTPLHFLAVSLALLLLTNAPRIHANDFLERRFVNARGESMRYLLFIPKEYDEQKNIRSCFGCTAAVRAATA